MKIIALPDLHGSGRFLDALGPHLAAADVVLLNGDLTLSGTPAEAERLLSHVRRYQTRLWAIPGSYDTQRVNQYLTTQSINLHKQPHEHDGIVFVGMGGDLFRSGAPRDHLLYDNVQFDGMLQDMTELLNRRLPKILVTHYPPYGTHTDLTLSGQHIGSRALRTYIEEKQPLVCVTGMLHDRPAVDTIGRTTILNPGPLWLHRAYAYIEIDPHTHTLITAETRTLPVLPAG
jgi:uncharacterized protein